MTSGHCHRQIYASGDPSESPVQSFTVSSRRAVDNFTSAWLFKAAWLCFAAVVFRQVRAPTSPRYSMHFQPCHVQGIRFSTSSAVRRKSHGNHASPASRGVTNHTTLGQTNGPVANGSQFLLMRDHQGGCIDLLQPSSFHGGGSTIFWGHIPVMYSQLCSDITHKPVIPSLCQILSPAMGFDYTWMQNTLW